MKTLSLVALGLIAMLVSARADVLKIGEAAPSAATKMKNVDGKMVSIADVKGAKGTLVIFSCNHCPFAKAWEGRILELANNYAKEGIGIIMINPNDPAAMPADSYEEMQKRAKDRNYPFPYVVDDGSVVAQAFGASRTPEIFLFDKSGKLAYHGAVDDNKEADSVNKTFLKDALESVVAGTEVAVKETKAIGCGLSFYKPS
jgi:peroxiredoxin